MTLNFSTHLVGKELQIVKRHAMQLLNV